MFQLIPWRQRSRDVEPSHQGFGLMRNEFDNLFNRFFGNWPTVDNGRRTWGVDTDENDNEVVVRFEVPGFETDELDVQVTENQLAVKAERKANCENEKRYSSFTHSVLLPNNVDVEKIEAKHHNGVLEIHAPKKPEAVGRRIEVKA